MLFLKCLYIYKKITPFDQFEAQSLNHFKIQNTYVLNKVQLQDMEKLES
mgnify:CR=1 FL=1